MTTQTGKGGKQAASPNDTEIIHMVADHDNHGDTVTWCQQQFVPTTEEFAKATCPTCLKVIKIYSEGAAVRLQQLAGRQSDLHLDVDFETARALHRVVRGMHDGECPKCHHLHESPTMRRYVEGKLIFDLVCPNPECHFTITAAEQNTAIQAFAPVMDRNLAVFETWRGARQ